MRPERARLAVVALASSLLGTAVVEIAAEQLPPGVKRVCVPAEDGRTWECGTTADPPRQRPVAPRDSPPPPSFLAAPGGAEVSPIAEAPAAQPEPIEPPRTDEFPEAPDRDESVVSEEASDASETADTVVEAPAEVVPEPEPQPEPAPEPEPVSEAEAEPIAETPPESPRANAPPPFIAAPRPAYRPGPPVAVEPAPEAAAEASASEAEPVAEEPPADAPIVEEAAPETAPVVEDAAPVAEAPAPEPAPVEEEPDAPAEPEPLAETSREPTTPSFDAAAAPLGAAEFLALPGEGHTVQIANASSPDGFGAALAALGIDPATAYALPMRRPDGGTWWTLVWSSFPDSASARAARNALPQAGGIVVGYPRRISALQNELR